MNRITRAVSERLRPAVVDPTSVGAVAERLGSLPRYQPGTVDVLGRTLAYVDGPSTAVQLRDLFLRGAYDFTCTTSTPTIIDGGANIGCAALRWLTLFPKARIECFEPDPDVFDTLRRNLGADDRVTLRQAALWREAGPLQFAQTGADAGRVDGLTATDAAVASVDAVTLASVLSELGHVDLLKLDIEGAEWDVLDASQGALGEVDRMIVEYHSFVDQPQRLPDVFRLLVDAGFRVHVHNDDAAATPLTGVPSYLGMDLQLNIFAWRPAR